MCLSARGAVTCHTLPMGREDVVRLPTVLAVPSHGLPRPRATPDSARNHTREYSPGRSSIKENESAAKARTRETPRPQGGVASPSSP